MDLGEIQSKNSFCLDCQPKKFKSGEIHNKTDFLFGFPGFSKESGKSKQ
jgi:hypothetical protein